MWNQPKTTTRALVYNRPTFGILYLSAIYALQSFFFAANWWSWGLYTHSYPILVAGFLLSPIIGIIWLYYMGLIYRVTGMMLRGPARSSHLRTAIAWSHIPYSISLLMWFVLFFTHVDIFVHDADGPSSIFINFIALISYIWTLSLLAPSLRLLQHFSLLKAIINIFLATLLSSAVLILLFGVSRYMYISI